MTEFIKLVIAFDIGFISAYILILLTFKMKGKSMKKLLKNIVLGVLLAYLAIIAFNLFKEYRYQQLENKYQMCIAR